MSKITFGTDNARFFVVLRQRTEEYFKQNSIKPTGNIDLYSKTLILSLTLSFFYTWLVFFTPDALFLQILVCILMGINVASIGFNVMHDGAHGSYSSKKWVNKMMGYSLNVLGGNLYLWNLKHNVNHHSFTNIDGVDDDLNAKPFFRTHTSQKRRWFHRFQHIYALALYGLTYIFWVFVQDTKKYFSGKMSEQVPLKKMSMQEHFIFWGSKIFYAGVFIVLPVFQIGFIPTLIGYAVMCFSAGFMLSVVFQLAHIVEDSNFIASDESIAIEEDWATHQINTTVNFGTQSKLLKWLLGGLNFQVEHHLFPRISHVHYPEINKIVKQTCSEFDVTYREFPTMLDALKSHLVHLKKVGVA